MKAPRPLREADLSQVDAVFTDVDGTLTTHHRLASGTVRALEQLGERGVPVVLVTGRPAGWAEAWARTLPVAGVIAENGGLSFVRRSEGRLRKAYWEPPAARLRNRARLVREVGRALAEVPGARLSMDSVYTEVDLAIDYNEDAKLGEAGALALERWLVARGITAVRSSVHVNCWVGRFDKAKAVRRFLRLAWGRAALERLERYVYVGDSFNDAPLFAAFPTSVGVANVADVLDRLTHAPAFITRAREGRGFEELARAVLRARGPASSRKVLSP